MSIRKKLYLNFGIVLAIVVGLCLINIAAVQREHSARAATQHAFEVAQASEAIRFQMMENRQLLANYLLSGSSGDSNALSDGTVKLQAAISKTTEKSNDLQKATLQHLSDSEREWENNFARPLVEKRDLRCSVRTGLRILYWIQNHKFDS
jgi:CHASE3 domain sensor protein